MKELDYDLRLGDGTIRTVRAYDPGVPGLVVHRSVCSHGGWEVTHRASGCALRYVRTWPTRLDAFAFAQGIADLRDWRRPLPDWSGARGRRLVKALDGALRERGAL